MKHRAHFLVAFLFLATTLPVGKAFAQEATAAQKLVLGNTLFALDLYGELKTASGNLLFSPYSISTVGILACRGARGETAKQLAAALRLTLPDDQLFSAFLELQAGCAASSKKEGIEFSIASSFWPQQKYPFLKEYEDFVRSIPNTDIMSVDFQNDPNLVQKSINSWVEVHTGSRIKDILMEPPSRLTRLFLVNAIYFKGTWVCRFPVASTESVPFSLGGEKTAPVKMMTQAGLFGYRADDLAQVLELPYTGNGFSMIILLPRQRDGLPNLEAALTADRWQAWVRTLSTRDVRVFLPQFTFTYAIDLTDALKNLGIRDAFDDKKADFSGMDGMPHWLYAESVLHKAFVAVDERGTEAAAATAAKGCFPAGTEVLTADGPRAIETVGTGANVLSCDPATGEWSLAAVRGRQKIAYEGDLIDIRAGAVSIKATGNHPFFVLGGDRLSSRPRPRDVPDSDPVATERGRWVEAQALRIGDVLADRQGTGAAVTGLSASHAKLDVYNLDVEGFHTYAVHARGILVHNKASAEAAPEVFRADHPFLFLIRERSTGSILFMGRVSDPR